MSGGYFEFSNYSMESIADDIENIISNNENPDEYGNIRGYSEKTIEKLKLAVVTLRTASIMTKHIDYLLSGDNGEESFTRNWIESLNKVSE